MQRAKHTRTFSVIYSTPKRRNYFRSVEIRINSIYFTICIGAFKHLVCSFTNMFTRITSLACVSWINNYQFYTSKQRLIFKKISQLTKIPFTKFGSEFLITSFGSKSYSGQIFNSNSLTLLFSRLNNLFTNSVINDSGVSTFLSRKPFQKSFTTFSAFRLNTTPNFLPIFSIFIKFIGRKLNVIRGMSNGSQAKIHTNKTLYIFNIFIRNINSLKKIIFTFLVNQIGFTFNIRDILFIMTNKRHFLASTKKPYRSNIFFVSQNTTIISNSTKRSKRTFNFLINLITITNFRDCTYKHLSRKVRRLFKWMIYSMMYLVLIIQLFLKSYFRNSITNSINLFHSIYDKSFLFIRRQKFYFQCQFHFSNIQKYIIIFKYLKKIIINKGDNCFPHIHSEADKCVSAVLL